MSIFSNIIATRMKEQRAQARQQQFSSVIKALQSASKNLVEARKLMRDDDIKKYLFELSRVINTLAGLIFKTKFAAFTKTHADRQLTGGDVVSFDFLEPEEIRREQMAVANQRPDDLIVSENWGRG